MNNLDELRWMPGGSLMIEQPIHKYYEQSLDALEKYLDPITPETLVLYTMQLELLLKDMAEDDLLLRNRIKVLEKIIMDQSAKN